MPFSLDNLFSSPPHLTPLQRARRAAAAPAARAAHVARKNLEPCCSDAGACCGAASAAPTDVYVALRVHDTKITLLRVRAPPPRPPPAPVAADSIITAAANAGPRKLRRPPPSSRDQEEG